MMCYYDYRCSLWYTFLSQHLKNRMQTMQNEMARFIFYLEPRAHTGQAKWNKIGMLSVHDRVIYLKLKKVFKIFHEKAQSTEVPILLEHNLCITTVPVIAHTILLFLDTKVMLITLFFIVASYIEIHYLISLSRSPIWSRLKRPSKNNRLIRP